MRSREESNTKKKVTGITVYHLIIMLMDSILQQKDWQIELTNKTQLFVV
jgi:hypothetical protein